MMFLCFNASAAVRWSSLAPLCAAGLALLVTCLWPTAANAQNVGATSRAMPGVVSVGLPIPSEHPVAVSGALGYGWLDRTRGQPAGNRWTGDVAFAFTPLQHWTAGIDFTGRRDSYRQEVNLYGEPRLTLRYSAEVGAATFLGAQVDAHFIGAEAPSIRWSATSPSLLALFGARVARNSWLAAELGFHLDRSADAIPDVSLVSATDKRTLAANTSNGIPWGVGLNHGLTRSTTVSGELGGEWLVGANGPDFVQSPSRVSIGARQQLGRDWWLQAGLTVALSARGSVPSGVTLPQEPRLGGSLGLVWTWSQPEVNLVPPPSKRIKIPVPKPEPPPVLEPEPVAVSPVGGTLVDEGGRPLADVEVVLVQADKPNRTERTTADGQFEFRDVPVGALTLTVSEAGYDPIQVSLGAEQVRTPELVLRPAVPAGQVRGKVLDLQGNPIMAQVTVNPGELNQTVAADGSFELDLTPGRYVLRFEHPNFAPQRRTIVVKDRGVVILNISLIR